MVKKIEMVRDWRGNVYVLHERVDRPCEFPDCLKNAVRHACKAENYKAENYKGRTHWHGGIHTEDFGLAFFCLEHGEHLRATDPVQTRYDNLVYDRHCW